jgi:DNA-binding MurR/RpiR family transcriptional regulator
MVNEVNLMTPSDCFFAIALWKSSRALVRLAEAAHEKGSQSSCYRRPQEQSDRDFADEFALVPAESSELISSLVCATSAIEYLLGLLGPP